MIGVVVFGVEVDDLDDVPRALHLHRLVVIRGRRLDVDDQVELTSRLGHVVGSAPDVPQVRYEDDRRMHPDHAFFNEQWHADLAWCAEGPTHTVLYGLVIGRRAAPTGFVDTITGFDQVAAPQRAAASGWQARHHVERSRIVRHGRGSPTQPPPRRRRRPATAPGHDAALPTYVEEPGASHPVVVADPASGHLGVLLGDHAWGLDGAVDEDEGRRLIEDLQAQVVGAGERYVHRWRTGDVVAFDNRTVLHRREPVARQGGRRVLRRTVAWPVSRC